MDTIFKKLRREKSTDSLANSTSLISLESPSYPSSRIRLQGVWKSERIQEGHEVMSMTNVSLSPDGLFTFPSDSLSASSWSQLSIQFSHRQPQTTVGIVGKCVCMVRGGQRILLLTEKPLTFILTYISLLRKSNQRDAVANTAWP